MTVNPAIYPIIRRGWSVFIEMKDGCHIKMTQSATIIIATTFKSEQKKAKQRRYQHRSSSICEFVMQWIASPPNATATNISFIYIWKYIHTYSYITVPTQCSEELEKYPQTRSRSKCTGTSYHRFGRDIELSFYLSVLYFSWFLSISTLFRRMFKYIFEEDEWGSLETKHLNHFLFLFLQ